MNNNTILLCTVAMTLSACGAQSGSRYTPRPDVSAANYTAENHAEDRMDKKSYREYEEREQCQHYRVLPRNMADYCNRTEKPPAAPETKMVFYTQTQEKPLPIVSSYTIFFDHDKSNVRSSEMATIDRAMREISQYNPHQVTVTGYTDSSGSAAYNLDLSREREQAVSKSLLSRGIQNQTLSRDARGEYDRAVETQDGIRNQENRRVVIDFRR